MASITHQPSRATSVLRSPGVQVLALTVASWVPVAAVWHLIS